MLNNIQYKILAHLQPVTSASPKELFDAFPAKQCLSVDAELHELCDELSFISFSGSSYRITKAGKHALSDHATMLRREKAARVHDYLIASYGIVGGLLSGFGGSLIILWLQGLL